MNLFSRQNPQSLCDDNDSCSSVGLLLNDILFA